MKRMKPLFMALMVIAVMLLSGCNYVVLDPKGPVAKIQKDLILYSILFMAIIVIVVYVLFTFIVIKFRERPGVAGIDYEGEHGSKWLEILWTVIPIIIVIALSIPTVKAIYALEKPPVNSIDSQPLVIEATSVDWKWIFSYPEENIETVNYLKIPKSRPILFKLTSADSMASFWIPALGGQKYAMAGMQTQLYLQADVEGIFQGRNANFTGEGFTEQTFRVEALTESDWMEWVKKAQAAAPLTQEIYDQLMLQGHVEEQTYSSTHLTWVNHAKDAEYALRARVRLGQLPEGTVDMNESNRMNEADTSSTHTGAH
ncbi:cytochrome aa3 quinol oxidase subunit II [Paenibacillus sp. B01]|uniref:cytochrome aa3 quinol oxidase subunit II n=1 Tax=Paenibacillus sp. B01 TaxID=2660554 RepID=UPI00129A8F93|nr:cytochrome aa3 quinol oxidase subunit II [Paenibacillus sp. B01]QGG55040.1 cytochrome aa3 quinol oxidase subunit II [Paenibacillus sp. B01]